MNQRMKEGTNEWTNLCMNALIYVCMHACFQLMPPAVGGYDTCLAASGTLGRLSSPCELAISSMCIPLRLEFINADLQFFQRHLQLTVVLLTVLKPTSCHFCDPPKIHTHRDRCITSLQTFHLQNKWKQTRQHGYNIWAGYELSLIMLLATQDQDLIHLGRFQQKLFATLPPAAKPRRRLLVDRGSIRETWSWYIYYILPKHGANTL